jgi:acyl-CoA thioester hydrolase
MTQRSEPHSLLSGRLTDGGHELVQRVYFEDTDFSGRVYHARYLHFMERGRSDYLRLLGIRHRELAADGMAFAVRRMTIDFIKPAPIDDVLTVRTSPTEVSGARIELAQQIFREAEPLVTAAVTIALVGPGGRPQRLPPAIRAAFATESVSPRR